MPAELSAIFRACVSIRALVRGRSPEFKLARRNKIDSANREPIAADLER